ncbi:MAG: FeoB-associated Cys-rich membrane protein [Desulfovibrio sp.]|nr:FeoB-associated Cys-rich membrane protein [Desulfovibrio sp.]
MSLDSVLVVVIVACAVIFFVRRIITNVRGGQCDCGCGCGKDCKSKPRTIK